MTDTLPTVIILAAGQGRRFQASGGSGSKLEALVQGKSLLEHVLEAVAGTKLPFHLVTTAEGPGMGDSIASGVRATAKASGWLILPGDLPLITADSILQVAELLAKASHQVIVPKVGEQRGHPVGFQAECFSALSQLSGEFGAAAIVKTLRLQGQVLDVPLEDQGCICDVDTLEDLQRAEQQWALAHTSRLY